MCSSCSLKKKKKKICRSIYICLQQKCVTSHIQALWTNSSMLTKMPQSKLVPSKHIWPISKPFWSMYLPTRLLNVVSTTSSRSLFCITTNLCKTWGTRFQGHMQDKFIKESDRCLESTAGGGGGDRLHLRGFWISMWICSKWRYMDLTEAGD